MTVSCSITLSFANQDRRHQEVALVARALSLAAEDIRRNGGAKSSGNITDGAFGSLGTWSYTGGASG